MPRLKSLDRHVPGDFQYIHPEANQAEPFKGSFFHVCQQEHQFRRANPFLCQKHGWSLDMSAIERDVHEYNVQRCLSHGWLEWLDMSDGTFQPSAAVIEKKTLLRNAVAVVETTKAGIGVWMDFIGSGGVPVEAKLAEERAAICVQCPHNKQGGLKNWFIEAAVKEIQQVLGIFKDLDVKTKQDDKLGVCDACLCPLKGKVHVPMSHIEQRALPDVWAKLDPKCWMLAETGRTKVKA